MEENMSSILVTGGLGLIGHNVVKRLQDQGHIVSIMDTKTNYGIIPQEEINHLIEERSKKIDLSGYYGATICDEYQVDRVFGIEEPEIVIHMASFPRQKVVNANPALGSRTMSEGLLNLLEASDKYEVRKFIYISSSMVYGDFKDDVTEDAICKPQGQYGIMKLAGEWLVRDYSRRTNIVHTIIRPSAVYGPLDVEEDRVISKFLLTAMRGETIKVNGETETLDFTYVDDAADGIVSASLSDNTENKTYNITKSHSVTLLEAARMALELAGGGNLLVGNKDPDFPSRGALNIDAARRDFGFDPKVDVAEGFKIYYDWLKSSSYFNK